MEKNKIEHISDNELDALLNKSFLELDFDKRENQEMLEYVANHTLNKTSFLSVLLNKAITNLSFLIISVFVFITSFAQYVSSSDKQKAQPKTSFYTTAENLTSVEKKSSINNSSTDASIASLTDHKSDSKVNPGGVSQNQQTSKSLSTREIRRSLVGTIIVDRDDQESVDRDEAQFVDRAEKDKATSVTKSEAKNKLTQKKNRNTTQQPSADDKKKSLHYIKMDGNNKRVAQAVRRKQGLFRKLDKRQKWGKKNRKFNLFKRRGRRK